MMSQLAQLYKETRTLHARLIAALGEVEALIHTSADEKEQADCAYALREIAEYADQIRKTCHLTGETAQRMACLIVVGRERTEPIRTDYCTATADLKPIVSIPKRHSDPEKYDALMRYLKVPEELWNNGDHAAMQPHWPGLVELLARRQQAGLPLPPGIDPNKTWPKYALIIRGKKSPAGDAPVRAEKAVQETPF